MIPAADIYLPHSGAEPTIWTAAWAATYAPSARRLPCVAEDDYARYFAMLWQRGRPFIIVEQDVVPWPGAIEDLAQCGSPWCVFAYEAWTQFARDGGIPLGCVKFDPAQLGDCPVEPLPGGLYPDWGSLDGHVSSALLTRNIYPHQHNPAVAHIKPRRRAVVLVG